MHPPVLIRVVLYLATLVYLRTALFDYVYDDTILITINPEMQSWKLLPTFFTHSFWSFLEIPRVIDYYRPLVMVVLAAIYHLLGPAPGWFHLIAAVLHILATYLVYRLVCETMGDKTVAAVAAGIFGLHPTKVETAAWISGISDSLSAVFFLASMIAYFRWKKANGSKPTDLALSTAFLLLALFSKEAAVFAPLLIAIYEFSTAGFGFRHRCVTALRSVWPFAAITCFALAARILLVSGGDPTAHVANPMAAVPTLLAAPKVTLWYFGKQLWPVNLSVHYPATVVTNVSLNGFIVPLLALLTLCAIVIVLLRKSPIGIFFASWFMLMMAPPIVFETTLLKHDRYFYFASVATSIGVACVFVRLTRFRPILQAATVCVAFAAMAALTFNYESYWDNDIALFARAFQIAPLNPNVSEHLADEYIARGQPAKAEAVARAVMSNPNQRAEGWYLLGTVRLAENRYEEAREALQNSLQLSDVPRMLSSIGLARVNLKLGRYQEAARIYRDQIQKNPNMTFLHRDLAATLRMMGEPQEAHRELKLQQRLE